jgi:hypothetical protein
VAGLGWGRTHRERMVAGSGVGRAVAQREREGWWGRAALPCASVWMNDKPDLVVVRFRVHARQT